MSNVQYEKFIRSRLTELRIRKNVSEHRMSLELDKSGSYIRGITSEAALPSLRELFNIISYFEMDPAEFFAPLAEQDTQYNRLCERLHGLEASDLDKVGLFLDWITK